MYQSHATILLDMPKTIVSSYNTNLEFLKLFGIQSSSYIRIHTVYIYQIAFALFVLHNHKHLFIFCNITYIVNMH